MIKVIIEEEKANPTSEPPESDKDDDDGKDNHLGLIIGLSVGIGTIVILIIIFLVWHYLKRKIASEKDNRELEVPISYQLKEIVKESEAKEDNNNV